MGFWLLLLTALGLSMDAFSVAICNGLSVSNVKLKHALITGLFFGGFQAIMPLIGYYIGGQFESIIKPADHWIVFFMLAFIGAKMIKEAKSCDYSENAFTIKNILFLAVATSIDALAVGITFSFLKVNILFAVATIGITTFILSVIGVKIGSYLGDRFKTYAEYAGGIVLILIGLKILLEHLGVISF